jgi:hypothetical protein
MAAASPATLDSLSDDVLGAIFLLLLPMVRCNCGASGTECKRTINSCPGSACESRACACVQCPCSVASRTRRAGHVPRVCRRWHRIMARASMWPEVCVTPRDSSVVAWLRQRSSGLRQLTLHQVRCWLAAASVAELLHHGVHWPQRRIAALQCDDDRDQAKPGMVSQIVPRNRGAPVLWISRVRWRLWRLQRPSCSICSCAQEAQMMQTLSTLRSWYGKCSCVS